MKYDIKFVKPNIISVDCTLVDDEIKCTHLSKLGVTSSLFYAWMVVQKDTAGQIHQLTEWLENEEEVHTVNLEIVDKETHRSTFYIVLSSPPEAAIVEATFEGPNAMARVKYTTENTDILNMERNIIDGVY